MKIEIPLNIPGHIAKLRLAEQQDADALFQIIDHDRQELKKWMPWAYTTLSKKDELVFLQYVERQNVAHKLLMFTILFDEKKVGMIDLHELDNINKHAEFGYWLGGEFQGLGIMTKSVKAVSTYAFENLHFKKVMSYIDVNNTASLAIPKRLGML